MYLSKTYSNINTKYACYSVFFFIGMIYLFENYLSICICVMQTLMHHFSLIYKYYYSNPQSIDTTLQFYNVWINGTELELIIHIWNIMHYALQRSSTCPSRFGHHHSADHDNSHLQHQRISPQDLLPEIYWRISHSMLLHGVCLTYGVCSRQLYEQQD